MGVFDFLKKKAKQVFGGLKRGAIKVFKPVKRGLSKVFRGGARAVADVLDPINEAAKKIADKINVDLPIVGKPLDKLKSIPKIGAAIRALSGVSNGIDALEAFGKGDDKQALEEMKDVAKNLAPKKARRVLKLVDKIA